MKAIVYIHYGSTVFDSSKGFPIRNETNWSKPRGGLWASRQNSTFGWKTWCEQEEFRDCDEHNSFKFRLRDNAKIAVIHNMKICVVFPPLKAAHRVFGIPLLILKNALDKVTTLSSFVGMETNIVSKKLMICISVCMGGIAILSSFLIR